MVLRSFLRAIAVVIACSLPGCAAFKPEAKLEAVDEELPPVFAPLTFELARGEARRLFPRKIIRDDIPGYDGAERLKVTMVWGLTWRGFGAAFASISHDRNGRVRSLGIETDEPREACHIPRRKKAIPGCRGDYGPELMSVLRRVKLLLTASYGKPASATPGAHDSSRDKRQRAYKWKRRGFDLLLSISQGEDGFWGVTLYALRRRAPIPVTGR